MKATIRIITIIIRVLIVAGSFFLTSCSDDLMDEIQLNHLEEEIHKESITTEDDDSECRKKCD